MSRDMRNVEHVTWWDYVQRVSGRAQNNAIADAVGISPSGISRWQESVPRPTQAAAFARAYGRPVLEAFVAAGFLTAEEAGERPAARLSLASLDDDELLAEVRDRMRRGGSHAQQQPHEKIPPGAPASVSTLDERRRPQLQRKASRPRGEPTPPDPMAGEESQEVSDGDESI